MVSTISSATLQCLYLDFELKEKYNKNLHMSEDLLDVLITYQLQEVKKAEALERVQQHKVEEQQNLRETYEENLQLLEQTSLLLRIQKDPIMVISADGSHDLELESPNPSAGNDSKNKVEMDSSSQSLSHDTHYEKEESKQKE
jgi:hypothetical protein